MQDNPEEVERMLVKCYHCGKHLYSEEQEQVSFKSKLYLFCLECLKDFARRVISDQDAYRRLAESIEERRDHEL